jgi:hypothetical protein
MPNCGQELPGQTGQYHVTGLEILRYCVRCCANSHKISPEGHTSFPRSFLLAVLIMSNLERPAYLACRGLVCLERYQKNG